MAIHAIGWRAAMERALYGPAGYFSAGPGSAGFRTSATGSSLFLAALSTVVREVAERLGHTDPVTVVDIGAGQGTLLAYLHGSLGDSFGDRLRLVGVDRAPRPPDLAPDIDWSAQLPAPGTVAGIVVATEWLDNVPLDVAWIAADGAGRYVLVDPDSGAETTGPALSADDEAWSRQWWPAAPGARVELGRPRDEAWAAAVSTLDRGVALTVDYGHTRADRPPLGTLTGFAGGRQVHPVPDGSCDITAHVALDAVRAAGEAVAGEPATLVSQRDALRPLGLDGTRPPRELAERDPIAYVRALAAASQAAELTDPSGLGGHYWLTQPVRCHAFAGDSSLD